MLAELNETFTLRELEDKMQLGNCGSPIETEAGWLMLTHGVGAMRKYATGAILLDLRDPTRLIDCLREPFLRPEAPYETQGFFPNVVFSNGVVAWEDDRVYVYYGACDETTCLLATSIDELLGSLDR